MPFGYLYLGAFEPDWILSSPRSWPKKKKKNWNLIVGRKMRDSLLRASLCPHFALGMGLIRFCAALIDFPSPVTSSLGRKVHVVHTLLTFCFYLFIYLLSVVRMEIYSIKLSKICRKGEQKYSHIISDAFNPGFNTFRPWIYPISSSLLEKCRIITAEL